MEDPQDLVSIYQAADLTEAHFVKNLLADEQIESEVTEENDPFAGLQFGGSHVLVKHADEARARVIVDRYEQEQEERAERPDWICPKCHANVVGAFDECDAC